MMKTTKQIRTEIENKSAADTFGRNKAGNYIVRRGFYYRNSFNSQKYADVIKAIFPDAIIVNHGEEWKAFRGGASVAQSSHWWVEFKFPTTN